MATVPNELCLSVLSVLNCSFMCCCLSDPSTLHHYLCLPVPEACHARFIFARKECSVVFGCCHCLGSKCYDSVCVAVQLFVCLEGQDVPMPEDGYHNSHAHLSYMLTCPKLPKLWSNRVFVLNLRLMMADTKHMNIAFFHMHFPYHG